MRFKKVYIEITNICNLDCDFCIKNKREKKFMSLEEYQHVLDEIKPYTKYIYLHLMGESLMHPKINEFIDLACSNGFYVNITSNGYLINKIKNNKNIRQINISLQSFDEKYNITLKNYLDNIFDTINSFDSTIINYRIWVNTKNTSKVLDLLEKKYKTKIIPNNRGNFTLDNNIYISFKDEFNWPTINNNNNQNVKGSCRALKDHIGVLSNLDVVACCLDSNGDICFGNLKETSLNDILSSEKFIKMYENLNNNIKTEKLCINCNFIDI